MKFAYLVDRPELFPLVAQWNWEEWGSLLVERSAAEFERWLRIHVRREAVPTTLLVFESDAVVGTVSLVDHDLENRTDLSPWLASLYVVPAQRGKGFGRALVWAAMDEARRLGFETLHLYTPGQEAFYAALGWERADAMRYRDRSITIMRCRLDVAPADR